MTILILIIVCLWVCGSALFKPSTFRIKRTKIVFDEPDVVFSLVNDPAAWKEWLPWVHSDPKMKLQCSGATTGTGVIVEWQSKKFGSGTAAIMESKANQFIGLQLDCRSPRHKCTTSEFVFSPDGDATKVIWSVKGSNGYWSRVLSFAMQKERRIGMRLEDGLCNMTEVVRARRGIKM